MTTAGQQRDRAGASAAKGGAAATAAPRQPPAGYSARVAVVGAGQAGLVVARELLRLGHSVAVFEQSGSVGGTWNLAPALESDPLGLDPSRTRVHSSMYPGLRTNLPRHIMSYLDHPFVPEAMAGRSHDARTYPLFSEVAAFLENYADAHDLRRHVALNTTVVRIDPIAPPADGAPAPEADGDGKGTALPPWGVRWRVVTRPAHKGAPGAGNEQHEQGAQEKAQEFDAVAVCVGHHSDPILPELAGMAEFPGVQIHSHSFRGGQQFKGQRVLVVGASFSGEEIARHVADHAAQVYHSARSWPSNGPPAGSGLGGAPDPPHEGRPNLARVPMVEALLPGGGARLVGGAALEGIDAVVYCTGYSYRLPFLEHTGLLDTSDHHVRPLYLHMFPPAVAPSLALVGLSWKAIRPPQFQLQGQLLARLLAGAAAPLPPADEMLRAAERELAALDAAGLPRRYAHCMAGWMPQDEWAYNARLVAAAEAPPPAPAGGGPSGAPGGAKAAGGAAAWPPVLAPPDWLVSLAVATDGVILGRPDSFRDTFSPEALRAMAAADEGCRRLLRELGLGSSGAGSECADGDDGARAATAEAAAPSVIAVA